MSREIRRVPFDYKHPTEFNPYGAEQAQSRRRRGEPEPRLHPVDMRFVGLFDDYLGAVKSWEKDVESARSREGRSWDFRVEYHLTGRDGHISPYYTGEDAIIVKDEDQLAELRLADTLAEKPNPEHYMPVWEWNDKAWGWCLYETVTEGTPITPVFVSADSLIDHLATEGTDWDQTPMRRTSAEAIVKQGGTFGSAMVINGQVYDSTKDADILASGAF